MKTISKEEVPYRDYSCEKCRYWRSISDTEGICQNEMFYSDIQIHDIDLLSEKYDLNIKIENKRKLVSHKQTYNVFIQSFLDKDGNGIMPDDAHLKELLFVSDNKYTCYLNSIRFLTYEKFACNLFERRGYK